LRIQISVFGFRSDVKATLSAAFDKLENLEVTLLFAEHRAISQHEELLVSDFILHYFESTSLPVSRDQLGMAEKTICIFAEESYESSLLSKLGFTVILDPYDPQALVQVVEERLSNQAQKSNEASSGDVEGNTMVFSSTDRYVMFEKERLMYATSSGNYTTLFLDDEKQVTVTKQIGKIMASLPDSDFFRVHHCHLVNRKHILSVLKQSQLTVVLSNQAEVPVSRRKKKEFLVWLGL